MLDFKQVGRLLRQDWESPTDLARELYGMFTNKESRRIAQPLSIEVPKGQAGISISREKPAPTSSIRANATTANRPNRTQVPETKKPELIRTDVEPSRTIKEAHDSSFARPPDQPDGLSFPTSTDQRPTASNFPVGPDRKPAASNRNLRDIQVQTGLEFKPVRPTSGQVSTGSKAYSKPVFEASGEIRFSGITPVQFDAPPRIFNPVTDEYEPYDFDGRLTRIPLDETGSDVFWGQVLGGSGDTYQMNVFDDPDPTTLPNSTQSVKIVGGIDPKEQIPPMTWVYPVVPNGDATKWYGLVPMWI